MYIPSLFREERPEILSAAITELHFATLVTPSPEGIQVSHVPMLLTLSDDGAMTLDAHVARRNPHWKFAGNLVESVAIFNGPHAYISPSWYTSKREHGKVVPTWNYIAVHAHGQLESMDDEAWLLAHVARLTDTNEAQQTDPWSVEDAALGYIEGMTKAIVGLRLHVSLIEGVWKMAQHKSEADRLGVIDGLSGQSNGLEVAKIMRDIEAERSGNLPDV